MKLLLDLLQGAGASAAIGVRPFLPALVYGLLAADDLGVDFDGTAFSFLEAPWFLVLLATLLLVTVALRSRLETGPGAMVLVAAAVVLGARPPVHRRDVVAVLQHAGGDRRRANGRDRRERGAQLRDERPALEHRGDHGRLALLHRSLEHGGLAAVDDGQQELQRRMRRPAYF